VIWAVNYLQAHKLLPEALRTVLYQEGANVFTVEMLAESISNLTEFERLASNEGALFFEPPSIDERIINQFGFFSVMPGVRDVMDAWLNSHPGLWRKIVIPADLKWEVRDKLDQANITERVLFPGMDGLSRWLKRHYSPKT
jgi:hypothetical protein